MTGEKTVAAMTMAIVIQTVPVPMRSVPMRTERLPQYQKALDFNRGINGFLELSVRGFAPDNRKKPCAEALGGLFPF